MSETTYRAPIPAPRIQFRSYDPLPFGVYGFDQCIVRGRGSGDYYTSHESRSNDRNAAKLLTVAEVIDRNGPWRPISLTVEVLPRVMPKARLEFARETQASVWAVMGVAGVLTHDLCIVKGQVSGDYYTQVPSNNSNENRERHTPDRNQALIVTAFEAAASDAWGNISSVIEVLNLPPQAAVPAQPLTFEQRVPKDIAALVELTPLNPQVRAKLLAILKVPVPEEAKTYDAIKAWAETLPTTPAMAAKAVAQANPVAFHFTAGCTDVEYGSCNYRVRREGSQEYQFTHQELDELVEANANESGEWSDLMSAVREALSDKISDDPPSMDWDEDGESTSEHEMSSCDDREERYNRSALEREVMAWVRQHRPDEADELGIE